MTGAVMVLMGSGEAAGGGSPTPTDAYPSPSTVGKTRSGAGTATTPTCTIVATFGTGPYTYAWTKASGDAFAITSPTAAATTFSIYLSNGEDKAAVMQCIVTDSVAATRTVYADVYASSTFTGGGGQPF